jgi:hypothetical protein
LRTLNSIRGLQRFDGNAISASGGLRSCRVSHPGVNHERRILAGVRGNALFHFNSKSGNRTMSDPFIFVVIGDMPYRRKRDLDRFEQLIETVNRLQPAFTVHVGDIKRSKQPCTKQRYKRIHALFNLFTGPVIYTPGDNDWADCHKGAAGSYDPRERLALLRGLFFPCDQTLGVSAMTVQRQSDEDHHRDFVENARWIHGDCLFTTFHTTGNNNNRDLDRAEFRIRNGANLAWIQAAFDIARDRALRGIVLATHANLWSRYEGEPRKGFRDTIEALRAGASAYSGAVLLVHGSDHELLIDKPLTRTDDGEDTFEWFMRAQVMGDAKIDGLAITFHPDRAFPFSVTTVL